MAPEISVLIPWRGGDPQREKIAEWVFARWRDVPFVDLCVGEDDYNGQPFNRSRALNRARSQAQTDTLVIFDADTVPDPDSLRLIAPRLQEHPWCTLFDSIEYLTPEATGRVVTLDHIPKCRPQDILHPAPGCMGIMAMSPHVWDVVGGFDEQFIGWGWEDTSFRQTLRALWGWSVDAPPLSCLSLWHARPDAVLSQESKDNAKRFEACYADESLILDRWGENGTAVCPTPRGYEY